jgi:signal transduction histidine kinase/HAMP domain-containing protein
MVQFQKSLVFKIGIVIVIIQVAGSATVGYLNIQRFSREVERRFLERMQLISGLLEDETFNTQIISEVDLLEQLIGEDIEESFIVNPDGMIFLYSYNQTNLGKPVQELAGQGIDPNWFQADLSAPIVQKIQAQDKNSLIAVIPIRGFDENIRFFLFIKTSTQSIAQEEQKITNLIVLGTLITLSIILLAYFVSFKLLILNPIQQLTRLVAQIQQGNLTVRTPVTRYKDEWHVLQNGFNGMLENLQSLVIELERRVTERTHALKVAFEVSQQITTMLELEALLPKLVELTQQTFQLQEVSIYLANGNANRYVLQASTSASSIPTLEFNPTATGSYRPYLDTTAVQATLNLPIILGVQRIGILHLESADPSHFSQTAIDVLQTLVNQIAIAVHNAQLFKEAQVALQEAEQSNKMKSQFLAMMSHELRTPLNSVINFVEFVLRGVLGPVNTRQQEALSTSVNSARHLLHLINDILDISKIEAGLLNLFFQDNIDLNLIFQEANQTALVLLKDKNVDFQMDIENSLPPITCDRKRVLQVVLNMISNACKFTKAGYVKLQARQDGTNILISVADSGPGIAPEDFELVFTPFRQTITGLQLGKGTGLGMPISKEVVEAHGGRLSLESVVGQGSTFVACLPCSPAPELRGG